MVWARLQADLNCNLRRGAWYRLIKAEGLAALVDVRGTPVPVVRAFLQMSTKPPRKWTVVRRPRHVYAVCPSCRARVAIQGTPPRLMCEHCSVEYAVDWDERYLA